MKLFLKTFFIVLALLLFAEGGLFIYDNFSSKVIIENRKAGSELKVVEESKTILFVGDIMLDRGVEWQIKKRGSFTYPFDKISPFLKQRDFVFGNLEGPINKEPKYFPDESLHFSFDSKVIESLKDFQLLSLANNHTLNMGKEGLAETKLLLGEANISFVGDPISCDEEFIFEEEGITHLSFNKTFSFNCENEEIIETIQSIESDLIIVSIHWGNEYERQNSTSQQNLAHQMIDAGADVIIGGHPHVVQNIEEYKGKFIFYSLGNFIFDQYFSEETQEGLMVELEIKGDELIYSLFPVRSTLAQPSLMEDTDKTEFLNELADLSNSELAEQIRSGIINR